MGLCGLKGSRATGCQSWRKRNILPIGLVQIQLAHAGPIGRIFFQPPTLMAGSSATLQLTETHSTSLERSKPHLLTQTLFKSLAALLMYFISKQMDLIRQAEISSLP